MSESSPTVSIIMPTYNQAAYIEASIESVLQQTFSDFELIIIDNYSKDKTKEIIRGYAASDQRIKYLKFYNHGYIARSRNTGIRQAKGLYIAFLDSDDLWKPTKLERQLTVFRQFPSVGLVYCQAQYIDADGSQINTIGKGNGIAGYGPENTDIQNAYELFITHQLRPPTLTVMSKKDVIMAAGFFFEWVKYQVEDSILWARIMMKNSVFFIPESLALYRVHRDSYTSKMTSLRSLDSKLEFYFNLYPYTGHGDLLLKQELTRLSNKLMFRRELPFVQRWVRILQILSFLYRCDQLSIWGVLKKVSYIPLKEFFRKAINRIKGMRI